MDRKGAARPQLHRADPERTSVTRTIAIALTIVTGFTGLVYEVTWQKYLATLLGSHAEATASVLAIFLGGLSAGYAIFGQVTRRLVARARSRGGPTQLLMLYAAVEAAIGIYALSFPSLFGVAQSASLLIVPPNPGLGFAIDVLLSMLLVGPPAVLMGGTIPILTLALAADRDHASRVHARIYGFNTAGAFLGALTGAFVLIPRMGLDGVLVAMGMINVGVGISFAVLGRLGGSVEPDLGEFVDTAVDTVAGPKAVRNFGGYATVSLLAGFAMMALQTTLNRVGALGLGSSHFTFAIVVAIFVLCIALGSLGVALLQRIPRWAIAASQWSIVAYLYLLYGQIENAPYWGHLLRGMFRSLDVLFYPYQAVLGTVLFAILVIPIGLSGALLPLLFHHLKGDAGELGATAGRLYSWNTIGSLLGALAGGYVLLFWLDLDDIYRIALAALVLEAAILTALLLRTSAIWIGLLVVLPAYGALAMMPGWDPERLASGVFRIREPGASNFVGPDAYFETRQTSKIIFHVDDPIASVSVRERKPRGGRLDRGIINNGKSDGNLIRDYPTMAMLALIPALLAERADSCFVIGYGTGVTAGELAALESVRSVTVAEISHAVLEAAPLFDAGNLNASTSPKVKMVRGDAYRTLQRSRERYDLIISEPSNPWVTGVEMLYSVEFLEAARSRLASGGVYAQWFHLYESDRETVELVLRTFSAVFPHVSVWYAMRNDLLLLGFNQTEHALDIGALRRRMAQSDFRAGFQRAGIRELVSLFAHELRPMDTLKTIDGSGPLHTLRHPILSDLAARAFFRGASTRLPRLAEPGAVEIGFRNSLLRRHAAGRNGSLTESALSVAAREYCRTGRSECATMLARWRRDYGASGIADDYLATLRLRQINSESLSNENLAALQLLFGGRKLEKVGVGRSLVRAKRLSTKFLEYNHPAIPFDRGVLRAAWRACRAKDCAEAKRTAETMLGPIGGD